LLASSLSAAAAGRPLIRSRGAFHSAGAEDGRGLTAGKAELFLQQPWNRRWTGRNR